MTRPVLITGDIFRQQARGGVSRYVVEVALRLKHDVRLTGGWLRSAEAARLGARIAPTHALPEFPGAARLVAPLHAAIDRTAFGRLPGAIVHPSYFRDPNSLPQGQPLVVTLFDLTHERFPSAARLGPERWKRELCMRADRVICISESTRRDAVERLGLPDSALRVAPLGSRDWGSVLAQQVEGAPRRFVVWVGPRYAYKNFEGALAALGLCPQAREVALLCIGGGPLTAAELDAANRHGVAGRVIQAEASDAGLRWAYERSEGLVYPSLWEGFGLPVLEAFTLGTPVLASSVASLPEVGGEAAFYADPGSPDDLATALGRMLEAGRAPERVAAGRAQAARFSWERCAALHDAVYSELE